MIPMWYGRRGVSERVGDLPRDPQRGLGQESDPAASSTPTLVAAPRGFSSMRGVRGEGLAQGEAAQMGAGLSEGWLQIGPLPGRLL